MTDSTDQLDLFTPDVDADENGYQCVGFRQLLGPGNNSCCTWCHEERVKYRVEYEGEHYITCCDNIYGPKINYEKVEFLEA